MICLIAAIAFAIRSEAGAVSVLGSLMCFAIFSMLLAVPTILALGAARIMARALAWQLAWIAFAVATSWAGHLATTVLRRAGG